VLLLSKGTIFDAIFRGRFLLNLRQCPMCLGLWAAALLLIMRGCFDPVDVLFVAGVGHALYIFRDKFFPCSACEVKSIPFKITES